MSAYKARLERLKPGSTGTTETRNLSIVPLLGLLGYQAEMADSEFLGGKTYAISHRDGTRGGFPVHVIGPNHTDPSINPDRSTLDVRIRGQQRMSPHGLVQEYLNLTEHLYGGTCAPGCLTVHQRCGTLASMIGLVGVIALLTVLALSMFITRIATIALASTGLSRESAKFQARSAFTGTGFTTTEAERVVDHPVRRKIINLLMMLRSAGLISILISLILSFAGSATSREITFRLLLLFGGVLALWLLANLRFVDRFVSALIARALQRWTRLDTRDYTSLLKLAGDYSVTELKVNPEDWIEGRTLSTCRLDDEGVSVLGIYRGNGRYLGAPRGDTPLKAGDTMILYGNTSRIRELDARRADASGDSAHAQAVRDQQTREAQQASREQDDETPKEPS